MHWRIYVETAEQIYGIIMVPGECPLDCSTSLFTTDEILGGGDHMSM
jgi:hypothetical protein